MGVEGGKLVFTVGQRRTGALGAVAAAALTPADAEVAAVIGR